MAYVNQSISWQVDTANSCSNTPAVQTSRCGSGAGRIAAVARLRRESDTAGHTAEKVSELTGCRAVEGLPGPGGREGITPFFFHNVLDKKQQSAIKNTRVLRLAVSLYWLKFYDENRHLPGWRFSLIGFGFSQTQVDKKQKRPYNINTKALDRFLAVSP